MLHMISRTEGQDVPLIIAHGLYGSARNWSILSKRLSIERTVMTVDMRNHGESPWYDSHSYFDMADDLAEAIQKTGNPAHVLGHSMGGKAAMVLAHRYPDLVSKLIVADIAPVAYGHSQIGMIKAMKTLDLQRIINRRDADQKLSDCISETSVRAFLLQSLDLTGETARWRLNLRALENAMPEIMGFPDIEPRFLGPVLFVSGGASDYVAPKYHAAIDKLFPNAVFREIEGAGHWVHAEKPREFEADVRGFLA